jgi:glycerol kinase
VSILVVDVGTSGLRAAVVRPDATVTAVQARRTPPATPFPGLVEFDAAAMRDTVLEVVHAAVAQHGPVDAVGIANQRTSAIVWDRKTGEPVGPGIGWQDLRTVVECLTLAGKGYRLAPNQSPTKLAWLLNTFDADRAGDLCFGTVDSWVTWVLSEGTAHVTDLSNAHISGLMRADASGWHTELLAELNIPVGMLPQVVNSSGVCGEALAVPGKPPIAGIAGDQQASLIGQCCVVPGLAKVTFGSGGMLDVFLGHERPAIETRGPAGTFPIVAWQRGDRTMWGVEAIMLSAGTNVDWLVDDLGLLSSPAESHDMAASVPDTDGVWYVPALLGLGTPHWDYGARGALLGLTRGSTRAHVVRAVLEGVAHRGADLVAAAEADTGVRIGSLRVDGGMSANPTFVQALADACARPVEVSREQEATTLGAAFLAGLAVGVWTLEDLPDLWRPKQVVDPARPADRDRWAEAVSRAQAWIPDLSALDF